MARRRITAVVEQQHRLRELGRIRFGERKGERRPGRPIDFPRVSSSSEDVVRAVAEVYGGTPQPWEREEGVHEWDVLTEGPIAVACPPGIEPVTQAFEQWAKGFLTVRCDGAACQFRRNGRWVERPCVCEERDQDFAERPCKRTTRISVAVVGIPILGVFRVDSKSFNAAEELPATLALLQASGRAAWMRMRERTDKVMIWDEKKGEDVPTGRRYRVIVVDAPFMPDEVMHLERAADMAALPAPRVSAPALPRGTRPQIGPGVVEPQGPQPGDRLPPPREPAPVDLSPPADPPPADEPEDAGATRSAELEEALAERGANPQGSLPGTEPTGSDGDPDRAS